MKFSSTMRLMVWGGVCAVLVGCGKTESTPAAVEPAAATTTPAEVPDLAQSSPAQLVQTSDAVLAQIAALSAEQQPKLAAEITQLQADMADDNAVGSLERLQQLAAYAKQVPGAEVLLETAKQTVSAWALKQGFDPAQIAPVLTALQARDYGSLASQVTMLAGQGGLSAEQKSLLNGVLRAYGIDAKVDEAVGKLKQLF